MRDAFGGIVNIALIVFFIVVAFSYIAFNINYTKAFRMKDKIIAIYNQYNGVCNDRCKQEIRDYAAAIGYKPSGRLECNASGGENPGENDMNLFCIREISGTDVNPSLGELDDLGAYHYEIRTIINIDVPIIRNIFMYESFQIKGYTKNFTRK